VCMCRIYHVMCVCVCVCIYAEEDVCVCVCIYARFFGTLSCVWI
jgi:hypothetical protein